eukprot:TRINITY_DN4355_c0_g1_i1.p1 TRINITY_DN4355_c0_g1~~TRINITY_DN4355_c0_g1_i1.p1  ORF type:complete len:157 (+),score=77.81 TRINITY_DN4355_c0_g1_i1:59-529(+)
MDYIQILETSLVGIVVILIVAIVYQVAFTDKSTPAPLVPKAKIIKPFKEYTLEELAKYDGSDSDGDIYVAIKGKVYDVTSRRGFYGKGGSYNIFAGKEASRALALGSLKKEDVSAEVTSDLDSLLSKLSADELETLEEWINSFESKYDVIGKVVSK